LETCQTTCQTFGDDEVEAAAERLAPWPAEESGGGGVPEHDDALCVGDHDGVGELSDEVGEDLVGESKRIIEKVGKAGCFASLV